MATTEELNNIVNGVNNGDLAVRLKENMKRTTRGIGIGIVLGAIFATFIGGSKVKMGFMGAIAGGSLGYLLKK